jgi:hypothetical protein
VTAGVADGVRLGVGVLVGVLVGRRVAVVVGVIVGVWVGPGVGVGAKARPPGDGDSAKMAVYAASKMTLRIKNIEARVLNRRARA